jgi:hypothetical protein
MGGSVVNYPQPHNEVIDWADVSLSNTSSDILWQAFNCAPNGDAKSAIRKELINRGEF